jgi:TRAP-type C4-dicarboxylate transport system permease small subunit
MSSKALRLFQKSLKSAEITLNTIGVALFAVLMFLGTGDVLGRYIFNRPITGALEIGQMAMAGMVLLAWANTQANRSHIKVDLLFSRYSPRVRAVVEFIILVLSLVLFSFIIWRSSLIVVSDWQQHRIIETIRIPIAPFKTVVPLGAFVLCLEFINQLINLAPEMKKWKAP